MATPSTGFTRESLLAGRVGFADITVRDLAVIPTT